MRNTSLSRVRKIILLASVLVLMLALCGCRTRITNNDEVSNVMYDEEGYRQDEYNMRRDALGLGKAPKPVFTGFGAPENEEEYDYGSDSEMLEDYDPDAPVLDPDEDTEDTSSEGTSTTGGSQRRVIRRNPSSGSSKTSEGVTVKLNPNGGTCDTKSVKIKTGDNYGELPPATREGYDFLGWYTRKDEGEGILVLPETKMGATKNHTLYAHWEKTNAKQEKKTFTVAFDPNGGEITQGESSQTVEEGSTASAPTAVREGYNFRSWGSTAEGGDEFDGSATVTQDQTWFAQWERDWEKTFSDAADKVTNADKIDCYIEDSSKGKKNLIDACRGNVIDDAEANNRYYVVRFIDDISEDKAKSAKDEIFADEKYIGKELNVLLIDTEAIEGNDKTKLAYKMAILNKVYGVPDDGTVSEGASSLGYSGDLSSKIFVY